MTSGFLYCNAGLFREIDITQKADASSKQSNDRLNSKMIKTLPPHCTAAKMDKD
jgi:hypothetical protein